MNKLSDHFWLSEFTRSQTASRKGIDNTPGTTEVKNLIALCQAVLQPLRVALGYAIFISSGYRSPFLNAAIGGSQGSQHMYGEAADLDHPYRNKEIFDYIKNYLNFDQLIWEFGNKERPDWVHVSFRKGRNRGQVLRAFRDDNGRVKYEPF